MDFSWIEYVNEYIFIISNKVKIQFFNFEYIYIRIYFRCYILICELGCII